VKYFLIILLISCSYKTKIKFVIDGDTVITYSGERIRLNNIDCPEHNQLFGSEATQFTRNYLQGQEVTIKSHGKDKYYRTIADIYLPDGSYFNQMVIKAGLAYVYHQYSPDSLFQDELAAKRNRIGLWASYSISPYQYRKQFKK